LTLVLSLTLAGGAAAAKKSSAVSGLRIGAGPVFGFGGENELEYGSSKRDYDEETTNGLALRAEYPLGRYVQLGFATTFNWWALEVQDNNNIDRNLYVDLAPSLKLRAPFMGGRGEVFVDVPIGLTIAKLSKESANALLTGTNSKAETGVGWNAGIMAGASIRVHGRFSIQARLGWQGRGGSIPIASQQAQSKDLEYSLHQLALNFGAFYTF